MTGEPSIVRVLTVTQEAAAEVAKITGGTLDYLINNAAYIELQHRNHTFDE